MIEVEKPQILLSSILRTLMKMDDIGAEKIRQVIPIILPHEACHSAAGFVTSISRAFYIIHWQGQPDNRYAWWGCKCTHTLVPPGIWSLLYSLCKSMPKVKGPLPPKSQRLVRPGDNESEQEDDVRPEDKVTSSYYIDRNGEDEDTSQGQQLETQRDDRRSLSRGQPQDKKATTHEDIATATATGVEVVGVC